MSGSTIERDALGDNVTLTNAADADAGFRSFVDAVNGAMTLGSAIALFVGGFLIFLTFSLAVAERTRTYGTMRALGALPRQVRRVVVIEAALLGVASGLVGLLIGYGLAALSMQLVSNLLFLVLPGLGLPVGPAIFSLGVGVVVSVTAAWLPGRRAAALSPVTAMRAGGQPDEKAGRPILGALLVGVGMALVFALPSNGARVFPTLLVLFGSVMLVPIVLRPLAQLLGAGTRRLAKGVGAIAVMHLVKERSRSAYTLALVMVVLAMILAIATSNVSMSRTIDTVVERQSGGTIQVGAPGALDPAVEQELAAIEGVQATTALRFGLLDIDEEGAVDGGDQFFTVLDPASYFDIASFPWVQGNDDTVRAGLTQGGAIVLPEQMAIRLDKELGDAVRIRTNQGVQRFTLLATYAQIGNFIGPAFGIKDAGLFGAGRPNAFLASVDRGVDDEVLRRTIVDRLGAKYQVEVQTTARIKEQAQAQLQGFFGLAYALLFVAALVGILGLANTMVVAVLRTHAGSRHASLHRRAAAPSPGDGARRSVDAGARGVPVGAAARLAVVDGHRCQSARRARLHDRLRLSVATPAGAPTAHRHRRRDRLAHSGPTYRSPRDRRSTSVRLAAACRDHHRLIDSGPAVDDERLPTLHDLVFHRLLGVLGRGGHDRAHWREVDVLPEELGGRRQIERRARHRRGHRLEPRAFEERRHGVRVVHREHGAHEAAKLRIDVFDDRLLHHFERGLNRAGRVQHDASCRRDYATHLGDSGGAVLDEHQTHLAQDDVERLVGERQRGGVADVPVDMRAGGRLRHVDHVGRYVERRNASVRSNLVGGKTCDYAGAAGDVEHSFAAV